MASRVIHAVKPHHPEAFHNTMYYHNNSAIRTLFKISNQKSMPTPNTTIEWKPYKLINLTWGLRSTSEINKLLKSKRKILKKITEKESTGFWGKLKKISWTEAEFSSPLSWNKPKNKKGSSMKSPSKKEESLIMSTAPTIKTSSSTKMTDTGNTRIYNTAKPSKSTKCKNLNSRKNAKTKDSLNKLRPTKD